MNGTRGNTPPGPIIKSGGRKKTHKKKKGAKSRKPTRKT